MTTNSEKKRVSKRQFLPVKIRAYIILMRPFTLLAPLIGGLCAGLMALGHLGLLKAPEFSGAYPFLKWEVYHLQLIYGAVTLVILNAASNVLNQVYDIDIDRVNKPSRPIPSGKVSVNEAKAIAWILYGVVLFRSLMINGVFAGLVFVLAIFTIVYSVPPGRLKKRLWISNISIGLARGLLGIVAPWCIFGSIFEPTPWLVGTIIGIFLVGAATTKDYTDLMGDKKYGIKTLPAVYGIKRSIAIISPFFVIPFLLVPVATWEIEGRVLFPEPAKGIILLIIWGGYIVHLLRKEGRKRDKHFENSPVWVHMYLMLMALQIAFAVAFIIPG